MGLMDRLIGHADVNTASSYNVERFFWGGEHVVAAFRFVRDEIVVTTRGIFVVDVQGLTGKKKEYRYFPLKGLKLGVGWGSGNVIDGLFVNGTWSLGTVLEIIGEWHTDAAGRELVNIGGRFRTGPKSLSGLAWDIGAIGLNTDNPRLAGGLSYRYRRYKSKEAGSSHNRGTTGQGGDGSGG